MTIPLYFFPFTLHLSFIYLALGFLYCITSHRLFSVTLHLSAFSFSIGFFLYALSHISSLLTLFFCYRTSFCIFAVCCILSCTSCLIFHHFLPLSSVVSHLSAFIFRFLSCPTAVIFILHQIFIHSPPFLHSFHVFYTFVVIPSIFFFHNFLRIFQLGILHSICIQFSSFVFLR